MKKNLIFIFYFLPLCVFGQTEISGVITTDVVWTADDSPYHMVGDIALLDGNTLTIEPGVTINVMGDFTLFVRGQLVANGTNENQITFRYGTSDITESEIWGGISIQNFGINYDYNWSYLNIKNGYTGINIEQFQGGLFLNNCSIMYNHNGIRADFTDNNMQPVVLNDCLLVNNVYALFFMDALQLFNTVLDGGEKAIYGGLQTNAIFVDECEIKNFTGSYTLRMDGTVQNTEFSGNTWGVDIRENLNVLNCYFHDNPMAMNIRHPFPFASNVANNLFCNNEIDVRMFYSYNFDFSGNCWCDGSLPEDGIFDVFDDQSLGLISFEPLSENCMPPVSVQNLSNKQELAIVLTPNPSRISTIVSWTDFNPTKLEVINLTGQIVVLVDLRQSSGLYNLSTENLDPGTYILKLSEDGILRASEKLIVIDY